MVSRARAIAYYSEDENEEGVAQPSPGSLAAPPESRVGVWSTLQEPAPTLRVRASREPVVKVERGLMDTLSPTVQPTPDPPAGFPDEEFHPLATEPRVTVQATRKLGPIGPRPPPGVAAQWDVGTTWPATNPKTSPHRLLEVALQLERVAPSKPRRSPCRKLGSLCAALYQVVAVGTFTLELLVLAAGHADSCPV